MTMEFSTLQLIDLPDELLVMIFKQLSKVELLYSLMGINIQLDKILSDSIFIKELTLFRYFTNDYIFPLVDTVLDRFCSEILPKIHYKINVLNVESFSMKRILLAADYPNLSGLGLYNIDMRTAERVFTGKIFYFDCFFL